jgi:hypothetical protein
MKRIALAAMLGLAAILPAHAQTVVKHLHITSIPAELELMNQAVAEFEAANPDIKVELPFLENEAFKAKLTTLLQSADAPDVFHSWGGGVFYEQAAAGVLRPVEDVVTAEAKDAIGTAGVSAFTAADGHLYGLARDVGEDARAGRLYLPQDWLRAAGIDPDGFLADPRWTPALEGVVADLLDAADRLYRRSESGIDRLPWACRPAIFAARFLYAGIGEAAGRLGADLLDRRAVVPGGRKARLVGRALVRTLLVSGTADGPPLPETRFLVEAAALRQADDGVLEGRLARVIVMFVRLARTDAPAG